MKKWLLFIGLLLFAFMGKAMAGEYVTTYDLTNEKLIVETGVESGNVTFQLKAQNLPANGLGFYLYMVKSPTDPFNNSLLTESADSGCQPPTASRNMSGLILIDKDKENVASISPRWYLYKNYNYARIVYTEKVDNKTYCRVSTEAVAIDKEGQGKLLKKTEMYSIAVNLLSNDYEAIPSFPSVDVPPYEFKINSVVKIGRVTDNTLLRKLSVDFDGNINELINYAKNDKTNIVFEGTNEYTYKLVFEGAGDVINSKVDPNGIYYVYNTLTSDEVELRNLDGILLTKPEKHDGSYSLSAFTDLSGEGFDSKGAADPIESIEVDDAPEQQTKESGTVANPNTGMFVGFVGLFVISVSILILFIKNKKQFFKI